jgi:ribonuclease HII
MQRVQRLELIDRLSATERSCDAYAGIDEVGVDSIAGPMVAAVVVLPLSHGVARLPVDSKRLDPESVQRLASLIVPIARFAWIGALDAATVDEMGVHAARNLLWQAAADAVRAVWPEVPIIIDGGDLIPDVENQTAIPRADGAYDAVSAAAIIAKARCDNALAELDERHPGYGLARHKGYRTKEHVIALLRLGPSEAHRRKATERTIAKGVPREEADLSLEAIQLKVREVAGVIKEHRDLASEFETRFMSGMWTMVIERGRLPSARQQFFIIKTHKAITKAARRRGLVPSASPASDDDR